jgi:hypothetical protein
MATYVNDLRLKEITTGDESGTWGTSTNTNLELIAEAFSYGTEVITTNADTHTTTIADGASDPGRALYLKYTGTLDSACTITIGPDTVSKVWIIENGTSGSQNIIISQGSGADITIPAGDTKVVYSDGAGAGAAFFDAFASLSVVDLKVQDDLTVTDDVSIGGKVRVGAATDGTGALMTFDSASNSSSLQMGNNSGGISPGGVLLYSASGNEFQIYQYTGVVGSETYGNPTFALNSIGAATFTPISAGGHAVFNEGGIDADFRVESDGNTHALFVDASTNRVGMFTATPAAPLEVYIGASSAADADALNLTGSGENVGNLNFVNAFGTMVQIKGTKQGGGGLADEGLIQIRTAANGTLTGGVQIAGGASSWSSISDERLKDIIEPITNAAEKVSTLRAVIGNYKTDPKKTRRPFLIAQDIQAVLPEAVDDTDENELSLRYTETIPLLVAAIQEQQALIESLTARITTLEG